MKQLFLIAFLAAIFIATGQPVKKNTDSLWAEYHTTKSDTGKIEILNDIIYSQLPTSYHDSMRGLIDTMLIWSEDIDYKEGLRKGYNLKGILYWYTSKFDSSLSYYEKALHVARQTNNNRAVASVHNNMALLYQIRGVRKYALAYIDSSVSMFRKLDNPIKQAKALNDKGNIYNSYGYSERALNALISAGRIYDSLGDRRNLISNYISLGNLYHSIGQYDKAIEYHKQALKLDQQYDDIDWMPTIYNNLGNSYSMWGKPDTAIQYLHKSIEASDEISNLSSKLSSLINLGNIYFEKNPSKALSFYLEASKMPQIKNRLYQNTANTINIGGVYIELGNLDSAKKYLSEGIAMAQYGGFPEYERNAYKSLISIDSIENNIDSAMAHFRYYIELTNRIKDENIRKRVAELEIEYETEKKHAENIQLKKENQLNQQIIQNQKYIVIIIATALLVVFLLTIGIFFSHKKVLKLNKRLEQLNNTKDKFFSIVAHDLKSPFNTLLGFLQELHDHYEEFNEEERRTIIKELIANSENTFKLLVNLLDWARSQRGMLEVRSTHINLYKLVDEHMYGLKEGAGAKELSLSNEVPDNISVYGDLTMTSTIITNMVNNAIKFTPRGGTIILSANTVNGFVRINVKDTGKGIPYDKQKDLFDPGSEYRELGTENEKGTGLGLIICKELVTKMKGDIGVDSTPGKGSTFYFSLPKAIP